MKHVAVMLLSAMVVMPATPQTPAQKPKFEVASIKPDSSGSPASAAFLNGRFIATNAPLKVLLGLAYRSNGRPFYQIIGGPNWIASAGYDVDAKTADSRPIAVEQASQIFQSLLEERFRLKVHSETRELPVYHLVVPKSARLKLSEDQTPMPVEGTTEARTLDRSGEPPRGSYRIVQDRSPGGTLTVRGTAMSSSAVANMIERFVSRPVRDETGLKGLFDLELQFVRQPLSVT
jgi:uncharacterized protein (TIGR03435 family)